MNKLQTTCETYIYIYIFCILYTFIVFYYQFLLLQFFIVFYYFYMLIFFYILFYILFLYNYFYIYLEVWKTYEILFFFRVFLFCFVLLLISLIKFVADVLYHVKLKCMYVFVHGKVYANVIRFRHLQHDRLTKPVMFLMYILVQANRFGSPRSNTSGYKYHPNMSKSSHTVCIQQRDLKIKPQTSSKGIHRLTITVKL